MVLLGMKNTWIKRLSDKLLQEIFHIQIINVHLEKQRIISIPFNQKYTLQGC